jgi:AraC-like DNA-binding protein
MTPELTEIRNWAALARDNGYQVNALADACRVSRWSLNYFFLTHTGLRAHEWLAELKQMDAVCLLGQNRNIKAIADVLGYSDPAHFGRAFKHTLGLTPGQALQQQLDITELLARKPLPLFSLDQSIQHTAKNGQTSPLKPNARL